MESLRVAGFGTTVFTEFSRLAAEVGAANLGQGFPDFDGPDEIKAAAKAAIDAGLNQYAISKGSVALRKAIAAHALRFYGQQLDPDRQIAVTSGATEAIFDAVMAFVDPGDEVVLFEPFYDSYVASITMAGGLARCVSLRPPAAGAGPWTFDARELEAAFSPKTRLVIVNTPHNPTGKVFTRDELLLIGALAKKRGAVILSDEVYEHLVFAPAVHLRPSTLPELEGRTVTISSGGKSFSFTGWKVGWALGPEALVGAVQKAHQFVTFATASPFQAAIAAALELPDSYFRGFLQMYEQKRDFLCAQLAEAGFGPIVPEGTYFVIARTDRWLGEHADDVAFCRWLTREVKIAAIPLSPFYSREHAGQARNLARFAFCKSEEVLGQVEGRLRALRPGG